jgi:hypothetical protein
MPKLKDIAVIVRKQEKVEPMPQTPIATKSYPPLITSQPNYNDFNKIGHTLLAKERVKNPSGLSFFRNISRVLMVNDNDGTELELFGCDACLSLSTTLTGIRIHAGRIHNNAPKATSKTIKKLVASQYPSVAKDNESVVKDNPVEALRGLIAELEYWKDLANAHEQRLAKIRTALTEQ